VFRVRVNVRGNHLRPALLEPMLEELQVELGAISRDSQVETGAGEAPMATVAAREQQEEEQGDTRGEDGGHVGGRPNGRDWSRDRLDRRFRHRRRIDGVAVRGGGRISPEQLALEIREGHASHGARGSL